MGSIRVEREIRERAQATISTGFHEESGDDMTFIEGDMRAAKMSLKEMVCARVSSQADGVLSDLLSDRGELTYHRRVEAPAFGHDELELGFPLEDEERMYVLHTDTGKRYQVSWDISVRVEMEEIE